MKKITLLVLTILFMMPTKSSAFWGQSYICSLISSALGLFIKEPEAKIKEIIKEKKPDGKEGEMVEALNHDYLKKRNIHIPDSEPTKLKEKLVKAYGYYSLYRIQQWIENSNPASAAATSSNETKPNEDSLQKSFHTIFTLQALIIRKQQKDKEDGLDAKKYDWWNVLSGSGDVVGGGTSAFSACKFFFGGYQNRNITLYLLGGITLWGSIKSFYSGYYKVSNGLQNGNNLENRNTRNVACFLLLNNVLTKMSENFSAPEPLKESITRAKDNLIANAHPSLTSTLIKK